MRLKMPSCSRAALAFALLACWLIPAGPALAQDSAADLFSPETLTLTGDMRLAAAQGEASWTEGDFGKLRFGGGNPGSISGTRVHPEFGDASLVWQPRLGWELSATVVGVAQGGPRSDAGLSEGFVSWKPLSDGAVRLSARAGLMWPPISLEHGGGDWSVTDTITPSAINSWVGEEVKVLAFEATAMARLGEHALALTGAVFDYNDTAGTLLSFRGWALHDRKALAFTRQPLPILEEFIRDIQPRFSHPLLNPQSGLFSRPGYYAKLAWDLPLPVHVEALHYDNNADPQAVNADLEWGWATKFDNVGMVIEPARDWQLRAQAMAGRSRMGFDEGGVIWVDTRFRAAYGMVTRRFAHGSISARIDAFATRNHGSAASNENDEDGWASTIAAKRLIGSHAAVLAEWLHVSSTRVSRNWLLLDPRQRQDQMQMSLRLHW